MANRVLLKKGSANLLKKRITSPRQAHRISRAISNIDTVPISELMKQGKVKRIDVSNNSHVYMYRSGLKERIIFTPVEGGKIVIHDIVNLSDTKSIKTLISNGE